MATGWAGDNAVNEQIEATIKDAVERARSQLHKGPSLQRCEHCDSAIPEARRVAVPGVRLCIDCQQAQDADATGFAGYNRRGSKGASEQVPHTALSRHAPATRRSTKGMVVPCSSRPTRAQAHGVTTHKTG